MIYGLFLVVKHEGSDLVGAFSTEGKAAEYRDQLGQLPNDCFYNIVPIDLDPEAPPRRVDLAGFLEVTSADSGKYREFVDDFGVRVAVPEGVEIENDPLHAG